MTFYLGGTYSIPQGNARASWYGFNGTPSVVFDGVMENVGGQPSGSMFSTYQPMVVSRMDLTSPLIMNANFVALGNDINVSVTIQVDENISNTNNEVNFFVCQEGYHGQSNMVVDMLPTEPFSPAGPRARGARSRVPGPPARRSPWPCGTRARAPPRSPARCRSWVVCAQSSPSGSPSPRSERY